MLVEENPDEFNEYPSIDNIESKLSEPEYDQFGLSKFAANIDDENSVTTEIIFKCNDNLNMIELLFYLNEIFYNTHQPATIALWVLRNSNGCQLALVDKFFIKEFF